jgi:NAD(P)H-hydrate epimerase
MKNNSLPPVISVSQMKHVDELMLSDYGISLQQMMEMAGRNLADLAQALFPGKEASKSHQRTVIVCGTGNNGGGGMVAARHLHNHGLPVVAVLAGSEDRLSPILARRWETLKKIKVKTIEITSVGDLEFFSETDIIIDAIIGYGLAGKPHGIPAQLIKVLRNLNSQSVISLDIPSGLNADDGTVDGICVRASATMTLALPKKGLLLDESREFVGDLYLADIGVPPELYKEMGLPFQPGFFSQPIIRLL